MVSNASNTMKTIESNRLYLRPWKMDDVADLYEIAKHPQIGPMCGWSAHSCIEHSAFILKNVLFTNDTFAILKKENDEIIGNISLMHMKSSNFARNEQECELGFWIKEECWNQGYMSEMLERMLIYAFDELNMEVVWCGYFENNFASARVQQKCGFTLKHIVQDLFVSALHKKVNLYANSISRKEWEERK